MGRYGRGREVRGGGDIWEGRPGGEGEDIWVGAGGVGRRKEERGGRREEMTGGRDGRRTKRCG